MRTVFLFIVLAICSKLSFADEQRVQTLFKSENGKYSFQYSKKKWKLKDETGKVQYYIKDMGYTSMTIFVSNDGQRIVIINDFVEGHKIDQKSALIFFLKGEMTSLYKLTDILSDTSNVSLTIWHTLWSLEDFKFIQTDSIFSLATFEFYEFEFDTFSGQIKKKSRSVPFDENTLIVFGSFRTEEGDKTTTMTILKYLAGQKKPNNKLNFKFKTRTFGQGSYRRTFMIKDGVDITPFRFYNIQTPSYLLEEK